jgi:hypothetical protein
VPAEAQAFEVPDAPAGSHSEIQQIPRVLALQRATAVVSELRIGKPRKFFDAVAAEFKIQRTAIVSLYLKS